MRWIAKALAAVVVLAAGMGGAQTPGAKFALVVGVSDYGRERAAQEAAGFVVPPPLANAVRDAELVAGALESKGFTVTRVTNPDKRALLSAVNTFAASLNRAGGDAVGLFYFAGHGAQGRPALERDIDNYLIPLGADLATEVDLESEALALSRVSAALRPAAQGAVVLILDACRDFALPAASRSGLVTRGLAEARAAPGTIIAYATSPGATALDALPGQQNGPYATALAAEIRAAQGARLEDVFIATRNKVLAATRNTQTPWENGSLRRAVLIGVAAADAAAQREKELLARIAELERMQTQVRPTASSVRPAFPVATRTISVLAPLDRTSARRAPTEGLGLVLLSQTPSTNGLSTRDLCNALYAKFQKATRQEVEVGTRREADGSVVTLRPIYWPVQRGNALAPTCDQALQDYDYQRARVISDKFNLGNRGTHVAVTAIDDSRTTTLRVSRSTLDGMLRYFAFALENPQRAWTPALQETDLRASFGTSYSREVKEAVASTIATR